MFSENFVTKAALAVAGSSLLGGAEIAQTTGIELSLVLWLVSGLLAIIALLLAAIGYFIRDMRADNKKTHVEMKLGHKLIADRVLILETEHRLSKCAYEDPSKVKKVIREVLREVTDEARKSRRGATRELPYASDTDIYKTEQDPFDKSYDRED